MKQKVTLAGQTVTYYSINLCSYGDRGDYEVFPVEELDLKLSSLLKNLDEATRGKWSNQAAQFKLNGVAITMYREGRAIFEGVRPDHHETAFGLLKEILSIF